MKRGTQNWLTASEEEKAWARWDKKHPADWDEDRGREAFRAGFIAAAVLSKPIDHQP